MTDYHVGRLLDAVAELDLLDDTLVLDAPYQWTKQVASHWGGTRVQSSGA